MPGVSIGSVSISVVPAATDFGSKLRAQLLPQADALGEKIGARISAGIQSALKDISLHLDTGAIDAEIDGLKAKLNEVSGSDHNVNLGLDDTRIVAALDRIGEKLDHLSSGVYDVELELSSGTTVTRLDEIGEKLDAIGARDVNPRVGLDDSSFNRQLDEDKAKLDAFNASSASGGIGRGGLIGGLIAGGVIASPALPALAAGGAATIGTLGLAVQGIMPALQAYSKAQDAAATSTGKTGASAASSASQIHSAQEAVSKAQTQAAHDAVTSSEAVRNAEAAVSQARTQAAHDAITSAETIKSAQAGVSSAVAQAAQQQVTAERQLSDAQYAEKQAQEALTQARQQAIITLQQLNNAEADTALSAEQAQLDLEQARLSQQQTDANAKSTTLQKAQADLSVRESEQRLKEAIQARTKAAADAAKANKEGVNGLPAVVAAQHNLAQSHQGVADAQANLARVEQQGAAAITKAQQSLADAVRAASWQQQSDAQAVAKAQQGVADASRAAAWQQQGDAQSVSDAQYALSAAYATAGLGSTAAGTAAAKYQEALKKLSPAGQQMVKDIIALKSSLKDMEGLAQTAIAPGFTAFLGGLRDLLPVIEPEITAMGRIISDALTAIGNAFSAPWFQTDLKALFDEGNKFMRVVGPAIGDFIRDFLDAGAKSGPAVAGLAQGIAAIVRGFGELIKNLAPAAPAIGEILKSLGGLIGTLAGTAGKLAAAILKAIAPDIKAICDVLASPGVLDAITGVVGALAYLIEQVPPKTVADIAVALLALGAAMKTVKFGQGVVDQINGVVSKLKGLAGKLPGVGTPAAAAGGMQAAADTMVTASAAMQKAADTMAGAGAGTGAGAGAAGKAGGAAEGAAAGAAAGAGISFGAFAGLAAGGAAIGGGFILAAKKAIEGGWKGILGILPGLFGGVGSILNVSATGWTNAITDHFEKPIRRMWSNLGHFLAGSFDQTRHQVAHIADMLGDFITGSWNKTFAQVSGIVGRFGSFIGNFFTKTLPEYWNRAVALLEAKFVTPVENGLKALWGWISQKFGTDIANFFTKTIPQAWSRGVALLQTLFITPLQNDLKGMWNWVLSNVFNPISHFLTVTLPGTFKSAVDDIGKIWNKLESIVKAPVNFIIDPIYDKGIVPVVNAVGHLIGLHLDPIPKLAAGGKITQGTTPTADDVLARVSKDETVVSAEHSRVLAPIFAAIGVPGYAPGGVPNPSGQSPSSLGRFGPIPGVGGVVGDIAKALKDLTGDALAAAANVVLKPLLAAMPGGGTVLGADLKKIPVTIVNDLIAKLKATAVDGSVGSGSGADVAKYAAGYATGKGHPYVTGGSSPNGWDCSGFTAWVYEHFGYFPEKQGARHGTSESQFTDSLLQSSGATPGALAFFTGSGAYPPPGHVGVVLNSKAFVSALNPAAGTANEPISGAMGFRIPKGGFQTLSKATGSLPANWRTIASYLVAHGFTKAEAAGIAGNIKIESNGNPDVWQAGGGGGYGLIQWTPPPAGLVGSGLTGELAQIVREGKSFFSGAGLTNPATAAYQYLYGRERPANPAATAAAREASANAVFKAMGYDRGGWLPPGLTLTHNNTGRPEPILSGRQWDMISAAVAGGDGGFGMLKLHKKFDRMIHLLEQAPGRTGGAFAAGINGTAHGAVQRAYFRTR